ncbi:MAG: prephenate dehydrogenase [Chloroflexi bacterium]|nr:prephenate dehydrogenase [Chloroflexota bacterium]
MKIAIVGGAGKMGRWFARFLLGDGKDVAIAGRNRERLLETGKELGVETMTGLKGIGSADVILISVPIDSFGEVVEQISRHVRPGQIIVDITSVKAFPVETMHRYLKDSLVLGVHPMFGPGARDIANKNFVLTPTNEEEKALARKVERYLQAKGARATLMSPREHDEMMAIVLGLPSLIATVSADTLLGFDKLGLAREIGGTTYKVLLMLAESVVSEDPELYASLQMRLPRIAEIGRLLGERAGTWADLVERQDRQAFIQRASRLRSELKKADPDFGSSYEDMYRVVEGL